MALQSQDVLAEIDRLEGRSISGFARFFARLDRMVYKDEEEFLESASLSMEERVDLVHRLNDVNRKSGYHTAFLMELEKLVKKAYPAGKPQTPVRILDIGVGGGELLERIHQWAQKKNIQVELWGIDVDPAFLAKTGEKLSEKKIPAKLILGSGQNLKPLENESIDIAVSSYVVHHVRDLRTLASFFEEIRRVSKAGWLIVDMERRFWGPPFAWFSGYLFGATRALVWDGVKSIRRAYTAEEINRVLRNCLAPGAWKGEMQCEPHPVFPYWIVRGIKMPLPRPSFIAPLTSSGAMNSPNGQRARHRSP